MCVPGEGRVSSVSGVVVWSDDLPPEDVIACEKIDVPLAGEGDGHCKKSDFLFVKSTGAK